MRKFLFTLCVVFLATGTVQAQTFTPKLTITWRDIATNETGFAIERGLQQAGPFTEISTVTVNVTTYIDTAITAGTTYCYRVRSFNERLVNSVVEKQYSTGYSNVICGSSTAVPATPTDLIFAAQAQAVATQKSLDTAATYLAKARRSSSSRLSSVIAAQGQVTAAKNSLNLSLDKIAQVQQAIGR